jgi:hypothetical protein
MRETEKREIQIAICPPSFVGALAERNSDLKEVA